MYIRPGLPLDTLKEGGTGSASESPYQPAFLPDRYESGTLNTPGIAGLNEGIKFILETGVNNIREHENQLTGYMIERLREIKGVRLYGSSDPQGQAGVISITIAGEDCQVVCRELDEKYNIAAQGGLHCACLAHGTIGTQDQGTIRFSPGHFNTVHDLDRALQAVEAIAGD